MRKTDIEQYKLNQNKSNVYSIINVHTNVSSDTHQVYTTVVYDQWKRLEFDRPILTSIYISQGILLYSCQAALIVMEH